MSGLLPDPARGDLDARALAWMRQSSWAPDEQRFDALAKDLFAFQYAHCAPYRIYCERRGRTPDEVHDWRMIPPVPTGVFKEVALTSFPLPNAAHIFRTSGTSTNSRGTLHLDTLELYEASAIPMFRHGVLPDLPPGDLADFVVLAPSPEEAPDSSLSHMFGALIREMGTPQSEFVVRNGTLLLDALLAHLTAAGERTTPLVLCGTAFAMVHLLDALDARAQKFALPENARVMETGGFKGRSRELTRDALYAEITRRLGVPAERIVNQYGMTELGSQFYDSVLAAPGEARRKLGPPWVRVRIVDPTSGEDTRSGERGTVVIVDLANTGSVIALQTADVGVRVEDGFEICGRDPGAEERGCSVAADEMLIGGLS